MINQTLQNRYRITEKIGEGSTSIVYKAHDTREKRDVALKFPKEKIRTKDISSIMRFTQQMQSFSELDSPHIVNIYDVFQQQNFPVVVTEYVHGQSLWAYLKTQESIDVDETVVLMIDILQGLEFIHSKGIIHRDIKPSNIMLTQENMKTKISDFGLALLLDLAQLQQDAEIAGTFSYMSPEQTGMLKKPLDFRSDIYSAGVLFYQLLTRRLPFSADDIPTLIHRHISQMPTSPSVLNSRISPVLDKIILKMLAKDPQDRYQTEKGITIDLNEYLAQRKAGIHLVDFEIARQDRRTQLTYQVRLIGRKKEMRLLESLVDGLAENRGNIVFIAGKAGSGKTRLVNELRSYAYTRNAFFVSGKCYKASYKTPHAIFREAFEDYLQRIKRLPSNLREEHVGRMKKVLGELGGEIEKITPKISDLLGKQPALTTLDPQKEARRFLMTVSNFFVAVANTQSPLVIFFDDLQWIDESSLEILKELCEKIGHSNVLILSTYRGEEVDAQHPLMKMILNLQDQQIPYHLINIKDLDQKETEDFIAEFLSESRETLKPLAEYIFKRTGGNSFFITEMLHALIDGGVISFKEGHYFYEISKVETFSLSDNVIDMLISRIATLTPQTVQVLSYSSVVGKKFLIEDVLELLAFIAPQEVLNSIEEAVNNQFLTRNVGFQEEILFVHDRVREAFYKKLPDTERIELNKKIALTLENQYRDNPEPVIFDLAYHFYEANIQNKALIYSIQAGHKAHTTYAHAQAISLYDISRNFFESSGDTSGPQYIDVMESLGEAYRMVGRFEDSLNALRKVESLIAQEDVVHRAQLLSKIGMTLFDKGETEKSAQALEQCAEILGHKIPRGKTGVILGIVKELFIQVLHFFFSSLFVRKIYRGRLEDVIIMKAYASLGHAYYAFDINKTFYVYLRSLNFAERIGPSPELAYIYCLGGHVWTTLPWFSRILGDPLRGLRIAQQLGDKLKEGSAYAYLTYSSYIANKPREGLEYVQKAIRILTQLGEYWDLGLAFAFRNHNSWISGRLYESRAESDEFIEVARKAKALQNLGWAYMEKLKLYSLIGKVDNILIQQGKESIELMEKTRDNPTRVFAMALLALGYTKRKQYDLAVETLEKAIDLFPSYYNKCVWPLEIFPIGAQTYLDYLINDPDGVGNKRQDYLKRAKWFCKQAWKRGKTFTIYLGWAYQVNGTWNWLVGNKRKAIHYWDAGARFLRSNTLDTYRLGTILLEKGMFLAEENDQKLKEQAHTCLNEARQVFSGCGAERDLNTVKRLLGIDEKEVSSETAFEEETSTVTLAERERVLSLTEVTHLISSILDLDQLLTKILELSIKTSGAERGFLLLYDPVTNKLCVVVSFPQEKQTGRIDFSKLKISKSVVSFVETERRGIVYPLISDQKDTIEKSESIEMYGVRSILCSPLVTKDKLLGMLYLDNHFAEGVFEQKDLEILNSICSQAAISIENARLFKDSQEKVRLEHEINTARQIQRSLLPAFSPQVGDLKVEGLMLSAKEVAGDYYDYINYSPQKVGVVVADVSGKGMDAGMVMSMVKANIFPLSKQNFSPKEFIIQLNTFLYQQLQQQKFISLIYAEYTAENSSFTWGGAGHEHVLVLRAPQDQNTQPEVEVIKTGGIVLGMFEDIGDMINQQSVTLNKGDRVILYSDGATEARNLQDDMLSLQRLVEVIKNAPAMSAKDLLAYLKDQVLQFMGGAPQYDDITLVVLGRE